MDGLRTNCGTPISFVVFSEVHWKWYVIVMTPMLRHTIYLFPRVLDGDVIPFPSYQLGFPKLQRELFLPVGPFPFFVYGAYQLHQLTVGSLGANTGGGPFY